jgi:hypothetical protein
MPRLFWCVASGARGKLELAKFELCAKMQPFGIIERLPGFPPGA